MSSLPEDAITVIGAGRLGLCWALCVEQAGYRVKAVDIFPTYVEAINKRTLRSSEPGVADMLGKLAPDSENLNACLTVAEGAAFSKYLYIFVQTPSTGGDRHYDHTHLNDVLAQLNTLRVRDKHIVICCTVMPGYCDHVAPSLLADCTNVTVSYSPEFIAQGAIVAGTQRPDMVLIGEGSKEAGDHIEELTMRYVTNGKPPVHRMSAGSAELAKLSLNSFITLKIAFGNFIGDLADAAEENRKRYAASDAERDDKRRKVDKMQIARALGSDSRVGLKCLLPGYGFGGPCFPRDGRALAQYARTVTTASCPLDAGIADTPGQANDSHARFQATQLMAAADRAIKCGAKAATIVFDDVTFKPRCAVPIVLESQKLTIAQIVRGECEHTVVIRSPRDDVLSAVKRDFGTRFEYWKLAEDTLPSDKPAGMAYIVADDELLPTEGDGVKVRVPTNTKLGAVAAEDPTSPLHGPGKSSELSEAEKRGDGPSSMPMSFTK